MNYDGLIAAAVVAELNRLLIGARVQNVRQHNATDLTLELRSPGRTHRLFFSADARYPRFHLTATSEAVPGTAPGFCVLLRKHLSGARISRVEQVRMDRIVVFRFSRGEDEMFCLTVEIMGKHSNIILMDTGGRILGAVKHVGASVSRVRQILPGRDYLLPPGSDKADPVSLERGQFAALWRNRPETQDLRDWLVATFSGFGPFLADEILARAGHPTEESVWCELSSLAETIRGASYTPVFITDERGRDLLVYPIRSVQFPESQQHPRASLNEALDAYFRSAVTKSRLQEDRAALLTAIRRAAASRRQTLKSADRTMAEAENAERYRQIGGLILGNLHLIQKGQDSAVLTDYFDENLPQIEVELDEKLSPQQNAERYFRRYRKARDSFASAFERKKKALDDIEALQSAAAEVEDATSTQALAAIRDRLSAEGLLRQTTPKEQPPLFDGLKVRRLVTPEGWEILYGETAQANDHLTQKIARPNDVWLHARAVTGAHVVIRTAGQAQNIPRSVLMQAASLAARNSQARHSSIVPVDYTLKKHVRKPRGSAPGFVTYSHEKTIDVAQDNATG